MDEEREDLKMIRHRIWDKLNNRSGITIVFALTVFLISCLLSMVIVNAALNNVQRIQRQRDEQQAMQAISSATEYVQGLFDGVSAVYDHDPSKAETERWTFNFDNSGLTEKQKAEDGSETTNSKMAEFQTAFKTMISGSTEVDHTRTTTDDRKMIQWLIVPEADRDIKEAVTVFITARLVKDDLHVTITKAMTTDGANFMMPKNAYETYAMTLLFTCNVFKDADITEYAWNYQSVKR